MKLKIMFSSLLIIIVVLVGYNFDVIDLKNISRRSNNYRNIVPPNIKFYKVLLY